MQKQRCIYLFAIFLLPLIMQAQDPSSALVDHHAKINAQSNRCLFEENRGQIRDQYGQSRPDVLFSGNAEGMVYHITDEGISYQLTRVDTWQKEPGYLKVPGKQILKAGWFLMVLVSIGSI